MATEIWILESLGDKDRKTGRQLSEAVRDRSLQAGRPIAVHYRRPATVNELMSVLNEIQKSATTGNFPVLHLEAHGDCEGLALSSGESIDWPQLSEPLITINETLQGALVLTLAACFGGHAARIALHSTRSPFLAVVGPSEEAYDTHLLHDYTEFYFEFDKTRSITKARWALNAFQSSAQRYYFNTAREIFAQLHEAKLREQLSPEERNSRIEALVAKLTATDPLCDPEAARTVATGVFAEPQAFVREAWRRFMFLDKFPQNEELFPFPL